jgi:hypothetical protein
MIGILAKWGEAAMLELRGEFNVLKLNSHQRMTLSQLVDAFDDFKESVADSANAKKPKPATTAEKSANTKTEH